MFDFLNLTPDQWEALAMLVGFLALGFGLIPLNEWLDRRQKRRDARRRNQARPWRR